MDTVVLRITRFVTGFMAGFAPFATMSILPAVMSPGADMAVTNWLALVLLSAIVGVVTVIFFERAEQAPLPREVFIAALGIPTMFIGTVSNLTTRFDAVRAADRASYVLEQTAEIAPAPEELAPVSISPADTTSVSWWPSFVATAHAQVRRPEVAAAAAPGYLIVIGTYRDQAIAMREFRQLQAATLRTERYAQKALNLYRGADGAFLLTYARVATVSEAQRIYRLLLINDPRLAPRIIEVAK